MSHFAFDPPPIAALPVLGSDSLFPVGRIFCVGRNYDSHAREMGQANREPPFFFTKQPNALVAGGGAVPYPPLTADLHHEVELVVAIGPGGSIFGYGVGVDFTRRDLQAEMKKGGKPWDMTKSFDAAAPVSALRPAAEVPQVATGRIHLTVNGLPRQEGDLSEMIWTVPEIIAELARYQPLAAGDLIFTGTPAGVGAVLPGDRLEGHVEGVGSLVVEITVAG
ncbi:MULTISPECIES: fumarylacetoacetate hydrolase family protein [unclassified Azospirillum]|uniref:fumarylacetoacetate hydrolase family protein n=1 Tax=unclassified Azospirillum TaxID=2630922 RepID=UPI000B690327|nr:MULTISPECIES: fumarylacetoacetate hydrolase family protein [unclassified Azospirillum]SNS47017.1 fumarylpyruvate hydrolase [Azospirillum sp. RU38E]SNS66192.1 fumarylpyruvate hydrolase [Azospirillum sp. RU37A]